MSLAPIFGKQAGVGYMFCCCFFFFIFKVDINMDELCRRFVFNFRCDNVKRSLSAEVGWPVCQKAELALGFAKAHFPVWLCNYNGTRMINSTSSSVSVSMLTRHGTGSYFVTQRPSDPRIQRPGDPVDPVTLFYNELQMST